MLKHGIWGVTSYYRRRLSKIEIGDPIIFYIKGGTLRGIFESKSNMYESKKIMFNAHPKWNKNEVFPFRIKIGLKNSLVETNIQEVLPAMNFIKKKDKWPGYFFRAVVKIDKSDYMNLKNVMKPNNDLLEDLYKK
jgi:predicted RNA-binding protein